MNSCDSSVYVLATSFSVTLIEQRLPPHGSWRFGPDGSVLAVRVFDRKERIAIDLPSNAKNTAHGGQAYDEQ